MGPDHPRAPERLLDENSVGNGNDSEERSSEEFEVETPDKPEYWTTVTRKRAHSEGSLPIKRPLTSEQTKAVKKATEGMTAEQKEMIRRRQNKVRPRQDDSVSSRGEGPSKNKGKTIDPREWGNVDIEHEDLDVEAQEAALDRKSVV